MTIRRGGVSKSSPKDQKKKNKTSMKKVGKGGDEKLKASISTDKVEALFFFFYLSKPTLKLCPAYGLG